MDQNVLHLLKDTLFIFWELILLFLSELEQFTCVEMADSYNDYVIKIVAVNLRMMLMRYIWNANSCLTGTILIELE
ncbi:hypothetical protein T02_5323 [Trichinella nativa]|uniref:Uncharacterized protein n=1 Tax=Trichinella nativa TaxID=6335 RepID=A0A0V1LDR2_9BILA|nr:hypothetical protein T02_5323 [Trichinella nativa]